MSSADFKEGDEIPQPVPTFCMYTDKYWKFDESYDPETQGPIDEGNPPMILATLPQKMSIISDGGWWAYLMCVDKIKRVGEKGKEDVTIDPRDFGVSWEGHTCKYTKAYCDRFGLDYRNNDCDMSKGQEIAEMIFGSTVTREYKEWIGEVDSCFTEGKDCGNAILGPVGKNTLVLASNTAKNIAGCATGDLADCGEVITEGPTAIPGKLVSAVGYGFAGLSSMGGDYTAGLTAQLNNLGRLGEMAADPISTLSDPIGTVAEITKMPLAAMDGFGDTIEAVIPFIGDDINSALSTVSDGLSDAADWAEGALKDAGNALNPTKW